MELKAQYDMDDLLDLVEQDLTAKGFRLVGGINPTLAKNGEGLLLTLAIEQLETKTITPAFKAPLEAAQDAVKENHPVVTGRPLKSKNTDLTESEQEKQDAKRAYWRDQAKKKRELAKVGQEAVAKKAQSAGEVVAPSTVPFHYQQPVPALNGHSTNHNP